MKMSISRFPLPTLGLSLLVLAWATGAGGGENCSDPTPIPHGAFSFSGDTRTMADDFHWGGVGAGSPDAVYAFTLGQGDSFSCDLATSVDLVLYVFGVCEDVMADAWDLSDDDPEFFDYTNETGASQSLFLVIDGLVDGDFYQGEYTLTGTNDGTVASATQSWDAVKALYR